MDYSPSSSSVHRILQARILEWVPIPSPGELPDPEIKPTFSGAPALAGRFFATVPPGKTLGEHSFQFNRLWKGLDTVKSERRSL